jgi:hypothetical protein
VAGCYECGDEPSGSCATELVSYHLLLLLSISGPDILLSILLSHTLNPYSSPLTASNK